MNDAGASRTAMLSRQPDGVDVETPRVRPAMPRWDGGEGLMAPLVLGFVSQALDVEMREHLGYERHDAAGWGTGNSRNGATPKIVTTDIGRLEIRVPRDRCGTFTPMLVPKRTRHLPNLGATVLLLYACGVPPRLALDRICALYRCAGRRATRLPALVLQAVWGDVTAWRARDRPVPDEVLVDTLHVSSAVGLVTVYAVVGRRPTGEHDLHGLWAIPAAAPAKPAPQELVGALRRAIAAPETVHAHRSADVIALVRRAWPRADLVADVPQRLENPFRIERQRLPGRAASADRPLTHGRCVAG
jgi:putative transposase